MTEITKYRTEITKYRIARGIMFFCIGVVVSFILLGVFVTPWWFFPAATWSMSAGIWYVLSKSIVREIGADVLIRARYPEYFGEL